MEMVEKSIVYDYTSSVSFINGLQTFCGLMTGFAFTGIVVVLTRLVDLSALLSQLILFILMCVQGAFLWGWYELQYMKFSVCMHSRKPIIPVSPDRWRQINTVMPLGQFLLASSIILMFLLKGLIILFLVTMCLWVLIFIYGTFYRWKPVKKELEKKGVV